MTLRPEGREGRRAGQRAGQKEMRQPKVKARPMMQSRLEGCIERSFGNPDHVGESRVRHRRTNRPRRRT
eukprot:8751465-Lingulodinium_polyedra.AAC.1